MATAKHVASPGMQATPAVQVGPPLKCMFGLFSSLADHHANIHAWQESPMYPAAPSHHYAALPAQPRHVAVPNAQCLLLCTS